MTTEAQTTKVVKDKVTGKNDTGTKNNTERRQLVKKYDRYFTQNMDKLFGV